MKKLFLIALTALIFAGCTGQQENPDQMFDEFYQGSPPSSTFSIEEDDNNTTTGIGNLNENKKEFTVSGESEDFSCTVVCEEK